ncbi:MAG: hypothetical protein ACI89L_001543 [Phycisphaerales bacterium]|jgi:hypothetical protein
MRPRLKTPLVTASIIVLLGLTSCDRNSNTLSEESQATLNVLKEEGKVAKAEAIRQLDEQGYIEPDRDLITKASEKLAEAASNATGDEKILLNTASRFNLILRDIAEAYQAAQAKFNDAGGLDLDTIQNEEDAVDRLGILAEWKLAAETMEHTLRTMEQSFTDAMVAGGAARGRAEHGASGFVGGLNLDVVLAIRGSDARFMAAAGEMLEIFRANLGLVSIDEEGVTLFDESVSPETIDQYNDALNRYWGEVDLQDRLTRQLLGG